MDILFLNDDLRSLCTEERLAKKRLGNSGFTKLVRRLHDLEAAQNVSELIAGHPHPLKGDRAGQFALDLDGGRRLVFSPAYPAPPLRDDGSIAWDQVYAVRVVFIGDYHD